MTEEDWNKHKNKKYYDHFCTCGCGGRIKVKSHHRYYGIPQYIKGHNVRGKKKTPRTKEHIRKWKTSVRKYWEDPENRKQQSERMKEITNRPEVKAKRSVAQKIAQNRLEVKEKKKIAAKEAMNRPEVKAKLRANTLKYFENPKNREKLRIVNIGKHHTEESKEKTRKTLKQLWEDPEFIKMMMKARHTKPNKAEQRLNKVLQKILPNEYQINVRANVLTLKRKTPDFVNVSGQKKIIELFGAYWHKPEEEQERIDTFAQQGYQTLVIWDYELEDKHTLQKKILEFTAV